MTSTSKIMLLISQLKYLDEIEKIALLVSFVKDNPSKNQNS